MLCDYLMSKLNFNRPKAFWVGQSDSETPGIIGEQQRPQCLGSIQLVHRRKRLRRMQSQNFIIRTFYSIGELFERIDYHQKVS